jgi:hypothetical protein
VGSQDEVSGEREDGSPMHQMKPNGGEEGGKSRTNEVDLSQKILNEEIPLELFGFGQEVAIGLHNLLSCHAYRLDSRCARSRECIGGDIPD